MRFLVLQVVRSGRRLSFFLFSSSDPFFLGVQVLRLAGCARILRRYSLSMGGRGLPSSPGFALRYLCVRA
jgi:hypothetical protein